jgi:hypothetical protein
VTQTTALPDAPLPVSVKAFSILFLVLGASVAVAGFVSGGTPIFQGDHSLMALQSVSSAFGGALVGIYGLLILKRKRIALGRWWFLAAWAMNFITPLGLFFFVLIVASTLTLRKRYAHYFRDSAIA